MKKNTQFAEILHVKCILITVQSYLKILNKHGRTDETGSFLLLSLSGLCVSVLYCVFSRPQAKSSTTKKQLSQKSRKSRRRDSSADEDDDEDDDEEDEDDDDEDTPKRLTRKRGATKVKRCICQPNVCATVPPLVDVLCPFQDSGLMFILWCRVTVTKRTNTTLRPTLMT